MRLKFTKMHGRGNDFVMLNGITQAVALTAAQIRQIADRHLGIGCDQLLLVEQPTVTGVDFRYRIFNADGGEVEQCGNGSHCFAQFVRDEGLTSKSEIRAETLNGIISPFIAPDGLITTNMGAPQFSPPAIPFLADDEQTRYDLLVNDVSITIGALSMGNPHAVQVVADIDHTPVREQGPLIERHVRFPKRVNAGYMQVLSRDHIRLRVWERGAGETLACGTGACAAVVTGIRWNLLDADVRVSMRGGDLSVTWQGMRAGDNDNAAAVFMSGRATTVYCGEINLQ